MKSEEKLEIKALPRKFKPLSPFAYIFYFALFCIPLFGDILVLVVSLKANNLNLRRFARAFLIIFVLLITLIGALFLFGLVNLPEIIEEYNNYYQNPGRKEEKLALFSALC